MASERIVDVDELPWTDVDNDGCRYKRVARAAGGSRLGCSLAEVPPGQSPSRYHYHAANEESMYVLEGSGTLRTPEDEQDVREGDYVTFPTGEEGAHTVTNSSGATLRCLFFSTMREPDVVVYPDEDTLAAFAGSPPGGPLEDRYLAVTAPLEPEADQ